MILLLEIIILQLLETNSTSVCIFLAKNWKKSVKSTIFELQQSFLHIFGVAQNFWFNGGGVIGQKGGGAAAAPPGSGPAVN